MQRFADYLARGDSSARIEQLDGAAEERDHDDLARQLAALMPDELERLLAQVQTGAL